MGNSNVTCIIDKMVVKSQLFVEKSVALMLQVHSNLHQSAQFGVDEKPRIHQRPNSALNHTLNIVLAEYFIRFIQRGIITLIDSVYGIIIVIYSTYDVYYSKDRQRSQQIIWHFSSHLQLSSCGVLPTVVMVFVFGCEDWLLSGYSSPDVYVMQFPS